MGYYKITHLKNGNVIYNDKEIELFDLPRPILFYLFAAETGIRGEYGTIELPQDDAQALNCAIAKAEENGYTFPQIPPKEYFLRQEEETRYYKYGEPFKRTIKVKRGVPFGANRAIGIFLDFVKDFDLMSETEARKLADGWLKKLSERETTEEITFRQPLKDKHGKSVIDWSQQTRQDEVNKLIRTFYNWLSKCAKK